ncbi:M23 family metallopeptidase [Streptomyces acidiscabies]|uniref:M23 family metallopeptidase n=1 Tax=Streptomyces acidiscabies TaxID=42234 RepID=A0AAP6B8P0_9ACTN|nr:M23 family metallopeptidase [Streptomyces acidiscabies]MBP5936357.1 M23 family metallopeptidase [Streptomyces sp. LBUM 1476]MBZ3915679.1 M23 family metallopeptidase [Streptomyces acidiscabies]MDX2960083.1 M23 family metallopeptidase [Streptomyces acidiscabies]MDX3019434.1 M23 family metallopeptidase [Streptomyces acidiscabies]MDX3793167.1 M23 family metallopeptidase [Streptomyces acidiscabies]
MAFTCATGRRRKATRMQRTTARAAGIAALTTSALAAGSPPEPTAANAMTLADDTATMRLDVTEHVDDRAHAQEQAVQQAAVRARTEALRIQAAEEAKAARAAEARAAREAERARLNAFVAPITGSYVSTGYRSGGSLWSSGSHTGIDFHAATGTPVHAVGLGTVVEAGWGGAYGNQIVVRMNDGTYTQYGHLSSISVAVGQTVTPGERIGYSGATGNVTGPHLHFEARTTPEYGSDIDPVAYLRAHGVDV